MKDRNYVGVFGVLVFFVILLVLLNVCIGSVRIPAGDALSVMTGTSKGSVNSRIIKEIRLPRALAALLLGGALSVAGFLLQTFFRNPIAGPFILGISSGAKLTVSLVMVASLSIGFSMGSFFMIAAAFLGAMMSMVLVIIISNRIKRMSVLIICGVMIGYICSAVTDFVITFADDSNIVNLHGWSLGSFSGTGWDHVKVMSVTVILMLIAAFLLSKPMSAYQMGDVYAQNVGVNLKLLRIGLILISSVLAATVTAFAGPVSFVGVAVPHLVKTVFKSSKPLVLIPGCFMGGAVFCLACDLIARTVFAPTELSISTVTAVFGAPVVLAVLLKRGREEKL
ncbi:MAG: iron ABC transporter permease [Lachnospiraceae bacterium]|nr:iron ABC transporter permease [Lachnospiraceae bacterium]